jgi:rhodanese-related sulfurtransferase
MVKTIPPAMAATLVADGAVLVDVREADEHARLSIPGARSLPLSRLDQAMLPAGAPLVFHCRSGARTAAHAERLARKAGCEAYLLEGGLDAWQRAGLPVVEDRRQPLELMRQVQIAAGGLVLLGAMLGTLVSPGFHAISAAVGAGLVFAGVTGTCGMANLLRLMPWNRLGASA